MSTKKKLPLTLKILFFAMGCFLLEHLTYRATAGFQVTRISTPSTITDFEKNFSNDPLNQEIRAIMQQPFYFLGSGSQSFAFVSEDGQYVLKVFKQHHFLIPAFLKNLPLPAFTRTFSRDFLQSQETKREQFMRSCAIAASSWKEETGTLYVHLASSNEGDIPLTLVDKLHIQHVIKADTLQFALQKKATLVSSTLRTFLKNGDKESAEACIRSLITLIKTRCEKGIGDRDPVVRRNFGFIGTQAVEIDIGSYYENGFLKQEPLHGRAVFFEIKNLRGWLANHFPELAPLAEAELQPFLQI